MRDHAWAFIVLLVSLSAACGGGGEAAPAGSPTSDALPPCPSTALDCLAWDGFDRAPGPIVRADSGQEWATHGLSCPECHPAFDTDGRRASMSPGADQVFVWLATVDTGRATDVEVAAEITLSPTPERANVGVVALFVDRKNHLTCKIEVTEGHPDGLLSIGEELAGTTTSLLAERDRVGLRNGGTYRLVLSVPRSLGSRPVTCSVTGEGIRKTRVSHVLSSEGLSAYGDGTSQGLRIKIFDDEDDGGSSWDDFLVRPR
jgi:hypothetical protein